MANRGPDGEGFRSGAGWCFGHRRLSVIDVEGGAQPWWDEASGVVLVYNGEIYNFRAIRATLEGCGHGFRTDCDTEVIVRAYLEWGRACLERFEGMFAFALYDPRADALWLVRDRVGVKPLFYHWREERIEFASSMSGLLCFSRIDRRIDHAAAWHYLRTIRTSLGARALISGVCLLQPGEELWWPRSEVGPSRRRYWRLPAPASQAVDGAKDACRPPADAASLDEAAEAVAMQVERAVQAQLVSDVPLGLFLSGGLDSSVMASATVAAGGGRCGSCSVGYELDGFNEWPAVREAARFHGIDNEEIHLGGENYAGEWASLIAEKGLPLSTPNEVPIRHLAAGFGRRFKVALSGEGADEVFGGYLGPTFCAYDFDRSRGRWGGIRPEALRRWYGVDRFESREDHFFRVNSWLGAVRLREWFGDHFDAAATEPMAGYYTGLFGEVAESSTFDAYLRVHFRVNLEGLLERLDSSTMAASVEGRVPFTDHRLVESVFRLPDSYKMSLFGNPSWEDCEEWNSFELGERGEVETKRLLRRAFSRRVPESVLRRPKVSFPVPFAAWFQASLEPLWRGTLADSSGPAGLLLPAARRAHQADRMVDPMLAWPLVNLQLWMQRFEVRL